MDRTFDVLLLDESDALRASLEFVLELEGLQVASFESATELVKSPQLATSRCLVLEHRTGGTNGLQLLEDLRAQGLDMRAILIVTAPTRIVRNRAQKLNALVVEKPLIGDALSTAIKSSLSAPRT